MKLVDLKTHQLVEVPEAQAAQASNLERTVLIRRRLSRDGRRHWRDTSDRSTDVETSSVWGEVSTGDEIRIPKMEAVRRPRWRRDCRAEGLARGVSAVYPIRWLWVLLD